MFFNYQILASLSIGHESFANQIWKSMTFVPSDSSIQFAKNSGLIFKPFQGGVHVLVNSTTNKNKWYLHELLQENWCISFLLRIDDPYWSNYTELNIAEDELVYLSNGLDFNRDQVWNTAWYSDKLKVNKLHKGDLIAIDDFDVASLELIGRETYQMDSLLFNQNGKRFLKTKVLDEGSYQLKDSKKKEFNFYLIANRQPIIGVFDFEINLANANIIDGVKKNDWSYERKEIRVNFNSRKTIWKYMIPKHKIEQFSGVKIQSVNGAADFDTGKEIQHDTGDTMVCYSSIKALAYEESTNKSFQLKKNVNTKNRSASILINQLPVPELNTLYKVDKKGVKYSEVYINF
jgi:hypothetical protein